MIRRVRARLWRRSVAFLAAVPLVALGQSASAPAVSNAHECLVAMGQSPTLVRNFNPFATPPLDFTWGGIYEPLVVVTTAGHGRQYNWLASRLRWRKDHKTLLITVRTGVRWSDGRPLTNRDVLYTLTAGRQSKVMDQIGLTRADTNVASVESVGSHQVAIHLKAPDSTFIGTVLANNFRVVPQHVFSRIRDVSSWTNPNPVGTGPFTAVRQFSGADYVLRKNPHYWRVGAPHFSCIRRTSASSNEAAVLQLLSGDVDVSNMFVPNAQKTYVSRDPKHFHFFYPADSVPVGLFFDDTKYPFSLPPLRRAMSMGLDRASLSREAEYGYAPPVDALGINRIWPSWIDRGVAAEDRRLASYDPAAARRALLAAGFSFRGEQLFDPRGDAVLLRAKVIAGWVDWVTAWRIIARNLDDIGIKTDVAVVPAWGDWWPDASSTSFATLLWSYGEGPTPFGYFQSHLDRAAFVPSGRDASITGNWEHFQSTRATALLRTFKRTFDPSRQHRLVARLERLWLDGLPFIPLFAGPTWSTYSTRYFTGFPGPRDFYIRPGFLSSDYVVALTRIRPANRTNVR
jgi:peptide/nickel transport system substrate-binding protein